MWSLCLDTIDHWRRHRRTCWLAAAETSYLARQWIDSAVLHSRRYRRAAVMSGTTDVVVAGGQTMSSIPFSAMYVGQPYGFDNPFTSSEGWVARYGTDSQFKSAQMIAIVGDFVEEMEDSR